MTDPTPTVQPEDRLAPHGRSEARPVDVAQLDTIQQRLFAIALALGLAGSDSTDAATATELHRLEDLIAELIVDLRALAHPLPAAGSGGRASADGDPRAGRDVS